MNNIGLVHKEVLKRVIFALKFTKAAGRNLCRKFYTKVVVRERSAEGEDKGKRVLFSFAHPVKHPSTTYNTGNIKIDGLFAKKNAAICDVSINPIKDKTRGTLFPRCVVVGFLYAFGSLARTRFFKSFRSPTVRSMVSSWRRRVDFLSIPVREKNLVYRYIKQVTSSYKI